MRSELQSACSYIDLEDNIKLLTKITYCTTKKAEGSQGIMVHKSMCELTLNL